MSDLGFGRLFWWLVLLYLENKMFTFCFLLQAKKGDLIEPEAFDKV